jgi:hypothetical protein
MNLCKAAHTIVELAIEQLDGHLQRKFPVRLKPKPIGCRQQCTAGGLLVVSYGRTLLQINTFCMIVFLCRQACTLVEIPHSLSMYRISRLESLLGLLDSRN